MKTFDAIDKALNTTFIKHIEEPKVEREIVVKDTTTTAIVVSETYELSVEQQKEQIIKNAASDYDLVRNTLKELMVNGVESLKIITDMAQSQESARSFEVATTMITTISNLGKDLIDVNKTALEIINAENPNIGSVTNNTQNNIYVGTNKDLQQVLNNVPETVYEDLEKR